MLHWRFGQNLMINLDCRISRPAFLLVNVLWLTALKHAGRQNMPLSQPSSHFWLIGSLCEWTIFATDSVFAFLLSVSGRLFDLSSERVREAFISFWASFISFALQHYDCLLIVAS